MDGHAEEEGEGLSEWVSAADKLLDALTDAVLLGFEDALLVLLEDIVKDASKVAMSLAVSLSEAVSIRVVWEVAVGAAVAREETDGLELAVVEEVDDWLGGSTKFRVPTIP